MNKYLIVGCAVSVWLIGYMTADHLAEMEFTEYKLQMEREKSELQYEIEVLNRENRARIRSLEFEFQNQLDKQQDAYEKTIADLRNDFKPSGVRDCPSTNSNVSRPDSDTSGIVCYTEAELRRKIEESLAIAHEADGLAVKYATVLKIVEGKNAK